MWYANTDIPSLRHLVYLFAFIMYVMANDNRSDCWRLTGTLQEVHGFVGLLRGFVGCSYVLLH